MSRRAVARRSIGILGVVVTLLLAATGTVAIAQLPPEVDGFDATLLQPAGDPVQSPKSPTSRLAQTDPSLLDLTGSQPVRVMVKLDYDSVASYAGGVGDLAPTSPEVTGKPLDENTLAVRAYSRHVERVEETIQADIEAAVPAAQAMGSFRVAFGGLAMEVPANRIADLLAVDGVVAVQRNLLAEPLTDATPEFLGATDAWDAISGPATSGEGVIVGVLDTGIWPEHPSFEDPGIDHPGARSRASSGTAPTRCWAIPSPATTRSSGLTRSSTRT